MYRKGLLFLEKVKVERKRVIYKRSIILRGVRGLRGY